MVAPRAVRAQGQTFLPETAWNMKDFPKKALGHFEVRPDWFEARGGLVAHAKVMLPVPSGGVEGSTAATGTIHSSHSVFHGADEEAGANCPYTARVARDWSYIGSHNASMPAWGFLSAIKKSYGPVNQVASWELGVVFAPVYAVTLPRTLADAARAGRGDLAEEAWPDLTEPMRAVLRELQSFRILLQPPTAFPNLFQLPARPYRFESQNPDIPWLKSYLFQTRQVGIKSKNRT